MAVSAQSTSKNDSAIPSVKVRLAANRLMESKWTQREAAVVSREKRVATPSRDGMNCGLNPPAWPNYNREDCRFTHAAQV